MRRAERRKLERDIEEMEQLTGHWHPVPRGKAMRALAMLRHAERADPRPPLWLSLRLWLAGVHDAW